MDRVTVEQAAHILGIKEESVRKRVSRGTLRSEKDEDGRLLVYVDGARTVRGGYADGSVTAEADGAAAELRDRVRYLERQVEEEREARRRADMLLARLVERVPELEAPESRQEDSEQPTQGAAGVGGYPAGDTGPQEGAERVSWWRRFFGFY